MKFIVTQTSFQKPLLSLFFLIWFFQLSAQQYSKTAVLFDLEYLKTSLEQTHFNLYAYTSKKDFERNFTKVKYSIQKDSFSSLEVKKLFQQVISKVNNGHTRIPFPVQEYIAYAQNGGTLFPLEVAVEEGRALVRKNWSATTTIRKGDELLRINGMALQDVFENIYPQISAERLYFKQAQLENMSLPRFYWLVFGEQKRFKVELKRNDVISTYEIMPINAIEGFEMKREDILKHERIFKSLSTTIAYIQPGDFGGDLDRYKQFIDSSFTKINAKPYHHLILDLRNHSGGDDAFGDYLVSYIADKPFKWASRFQLKSSQQLKDHTRKHRDTTQAYWQSILSHNDGETYDFDFGFYEPQPKHKRFQGSVYVLVNRQSYSQSTVTASQIKDYGWGTLVGEETGEYPNLYASIYSYTLPKTGVTVEVSKGKIERVSSVNTEKGLIPDILIKDYLLDDKDEILDGLSEMLLHK